MKIRQYFRPTGLIGRARRGAAWFGALGIAPLGLLLLLGIGAAIIATGGGGESLARGTHLRIPDPATLDGARAEEVYQAIRLRMRRHYMGSDDPVAAAYQTWGRHNAAPYRSSAHGDLFVNHYANPLAKGYGAASSSQPMPPGAMIAKDSFWVTANGDVMTGPLFLMEKMPAGFNSASGDWRYMSIEPDGRITGITGGFNGDAVAYCVGCHARVAKQRDHLYFVPRRWRPERVAP